MSTMKINGATQIQDGTITSAKFDDGAIELKKIAFLKEALAYYVSPDGHDTNGNGSEARPFCTVQQAINAIVATTPVPGDEKEYSIICAPGAYTANSDGGKRLYNGNISISSDLIGRLAIVGSTEQAPFHKLGNISVTGKQLNTLYIIGFEILSFSAILSENSANAGGDDFGLMNCFCNYSGQDNVVIKGYGSTFLWGCTFRGRVVLENTWFYTGGGTSIGETLTYNTTAGPRCYSGEGSDAVIFQSVMVNGNITVTGLEGQERITIVSRLGCRLGGNTTLDSYCDLITYAGTCFRGTVTNGGTTTQTAEYMDIAGTSLSAGVNDVIEAIKDLDTRSSGISGDYLKRDGSLSMLGILNANANRITGLGNPSGTQDAATKSYVDSAITGVISGATYTAGDGINIAGLVVSAVANSGITVDANGISVDAHADASVEVLADGVRLPRATNSGDVMLGGTDKIPTMITLSGDVSSVSAAGVVTLNPANIAVLANMITRESPVESADGLISGFTLANAVMNGTEHVYLNGMLQDDGAGNDYTIADVSGVSVVTFQFVPESGAKILASYIKAA